MALLGNYSVLNKSAGRWLGGAVQAPERSNWGKNGANRNFIYQDLSSSALKLVSIPDGNTAPSAWMLPSKAGGMSARNTMGGLGEIVPFTLAAGMGMQAVLDGFGDMDAEGGLVVGGSVTIPGSGSISATPNAALNAQASVDGAGGMTSTLRAIGWMSATLSGGGTCAAQSYAKGFMVCDMKPFTELSPQSLASAVWSQAVEQGFTAEEILRLMASVLAGKSSGFDANAPVFRDIADTKDRVEATLDASGNRVTVSLDAT